VQNKIKYTCFGVINGEYTMSTAKIIWIVGALAAIALAFVNTGYDTAIIAVLGLAGGFFVDKDHRTGLIVAAIFLAAGSAAWNDIPAVGGYLTAIWASYGALLAAASLMAIARTTVERLKP
jgi:hypothetical protein